MASALLALGAAGAAAAPGPGAGGPEAEGPASGAGTPRRVVSLNPSLTAILLALDARDLLVGVDDWSSQSHPEALAGVPAVGGLASLSLEQVVSLAPDLVVMVPSVERRDVRARMREVGVPVRTFDPRTFDEVLDAITELGAAVGRRPRAEARVAAILEARRAVRAAVRGLPRPRAVVVLQREPLFVVGRGSFIAQMLEWAGGRNLGAELGDPYPRVSLEWLVASRPEVLLDSSSDPTPAADYWTRLPSLPAVRDGRVEALGPGTATLPGPWLDRALWILARALHGDALADAAPGPSAEGSPPPADDAGAPPAGAASGGGTP